VTIDSNFWSQFKSTIFRRYPQPKDSRLKLGPEVTVYCHTEDKTAT